MANENLIYRGTTPEISIDTSVDSSLIEDASITFSQAKAVVVKKKLADCTTNGSKIIVVLSQEETFELKAGLELEIKARVKTTDGRVVGTEYKGIKIKEIDDDEVL